VTLMREHYMKHRAEGPKPGDTGGTTDRSPHPVVPEADAAERLRFSKIYLTFSAVWRILKQTV